MRLGDVAHDRQSEAGAAAELLDVLVAGSGAIDLVEALEDPRLVRVRDADAVVADDEPDPIVGRLPADPDLAAVVAVLDGVVREVEERLAEPSRIAERANVRAWRAARSGGR